MGSLQDHLVRRGGARALAKVHVERSTLALFEPPGVEPFRAAFMLTEGPAVGLSSYEDDMREAELATIVVARSDFDGRAIPLSIKSRVSIDGGDSWYALDERPSIYGESYCTIYLAREPLVGHGNIQRRD